MTGGVVPGKYLGIVHRDFVGGDSSKRGENPPENAGGYFGIFRSTAEQGRSKRPYEVLAVIFRGKLNTLFIDADLKRFKEDKK